MFLFLFQPGPPTTLTCGAKAMGWKSLHLWDDFIWNCMHSLKMNKTYLTRPTHHLDLRCWTVFAESGPGPPTTLTCSTGWRFCKSNGRKTFHLWDDFIWNVRADTNKEKNTYTSVLHEPFVHRLLTRGVGGLAGQFGIIGRCWFWQWKPKMATAWGCVDGWVAGEGMDWLLLIWGWGGAISAAADRIGCQRCGAVVFRVFLSFQQKFLYLRIELVSNYVNASLLGRGRSRIFEIQISAEGF